MNRQQSEIVFIEQALNYLKPGGTLAIVLPKSVATNSSLQTAREVLNKKGYIFAAVVLPPETFATTGTQASAMVLFIRKHDEQKKVNGTIQIAFAQVTNVGYDSTGRERQDNQLIELAEDLKSCVEMKTNVGKCRIMPELSKWSTFSEFSNLITDRINVNNSLKLRDIVEVVGNGRTPPRHSYTKNGLFVVKVGNLTGNGINWMARDRNFISIEEKESRQRSKHLMLRKGDILLTASAHSSVYIGKKVDIVEKIPDWLGGYASFVGEVMLIRPIQKLIDPYVLLAFLRAPSTMERLQMLIRGQTAHLYANDILEISLPSKLLQPDANLSRVAELLRLETKLNTKLNDYMIEQQQLLADMAFQAL